MRIAIASGKGGTGKTTLAANLAHFLASGINRKPETGKQPDVVLADLDVEEPNSGLFFAGTLKNQETKYKKVPKWNSEKCLLCGQCQEVCQFHAILKLGESIMVFPELCHSCNACSGLCPTSSLPMTPVEIGKIREYQVENLKFVEGRLLIGEEETVPLIKQTLEYLDNRFEGDSLFLLDSPPGTSCSVIETVRAVDFVILVGEPTPFGFHDFKLAAETLRELDKEFYVVINKDGVGNKELEDYCRREDIKVIAKIPNSRRMAEVYSKGGLLYEEVPEFMENLQKVADFILDYSAGEK